MRNSLGNSGSTRTSAHTQFGLRRNMDFFNNHYHNIIRIYLLSIGLWPYNKTRLATVHRLVCLVTACSFINFQMCKFYTAKLTVDLCIDIIAPLLFCVISVVKYITSWMNFDFMVSMFDIVQNEWCSITDPDELKIMQKAAEEGKFYIMCETIFCYGGTMLFLSLQYIPYALDIILPLNESRPNYHPFEAEYFVDSEEYFLPILIHMQFCITLSITLILCTDAITTTFLLHTCGIINIAGYRLSHVFDSVSSDVDLNFRSLFCDRITSIVRLHLSCKERLNLCVNVFAWSYIVQMVLIVIALTCLLLQLHRALLALDDIGFLLLTICRVIGHFLVVFLNILPAQRVIDYSNNLSFDTYSGRWYDAPLESRKLVMMVLVCTMEPLKMSAGNLVHMSFETFSSIVQATFSYFTVIHSIEETNSQAFVGP